MWNFTNTIFSKLFRVLDGEQFKVDPISVMNKLQIRLQVAEFHDYSNFIRFDEEKGFYCGFQVGNTCLGDSQVRPHLNFAIHV